MYQHLEVLSKVHDVSLVAITDREPSKRQLHEVKAVCSGSVEYFVLPQWKRYVGALRAIVSKNPFQVEFFYSHSVRNHITSSIESLDPDLVYCQLLRMVPYCENCKSLKILDFMDAFGTGALRTSTSTRWPLSWFYNIEHKKLRDCEKKVSTLFDAFSVISDQDRKEINTDINIEVVPNFVDQKFFSGKDTTKRYKLGFVGNMGYFPNVKAGQYIIDRILPHLSESFNVLFAGVRPDPILVQRKSDRIVVTGWIDDIRDAYNHIEVLVAPIYTGIGQQNKVLEAMSMSIPVITTSLVNDAIGAQDKESIIVANTVNEFVNAIQLLQDKELRKIMGERARKFIIDNYTQEIFSKKLLGFVDSVNYQTL